MSNSNDNSRYSALEFFNGGCGTVTICGSTKFFFEAMETNRELTFKGWIVLCCGSWGHSFHKYDRSEKERDFATVKKLHFHKILKSDAVIVVSDKTCYVGESTLTEIAFAQSLNTPVFYFDGVNYSGDTDIQPPALVRSPNEIDYIDSFLTQYEREHGYKGF